MWVSYFYFFSAKSSSSWSLITGLTERYTAFCVHERTPFPLFLRSGNDLKQLRPLDRFPTTLFPFFHFILFLCSLPIYTQGPPDLCSFAYGVHSHSERCRLSIRPSVNLDWFHCSDALSLRQERKKKKRAGLSRVLLLLQYNRPRRGIKLVVFQSIRSLCSVPNQGTERPPSN